MDPAVMLSGSTDVRDQMTPRLGSMNHVELGTSQ